MNLGFPEMIFIFFLALIIFGPKKLPDIGRQIGRALSEFKRASNEFKAQIESEINNLDSETNVRQILPSLNSLRDTVRDTVANGSFNPSPLPPTAPETAPPAKAPDA